MLLKTSRNPQEKKPFLELLFNEFGGVKAWNVIKKKLQHRYFPVSVVQFFKKPLLQNTAGWLLLLISPFKPRFYQLITVFSFFSSFFPFTIDNCNYRSLYRKGIKMKICVFFTMIYPKINMNVVKTICLGNNLLPHIEKKQISPSISLGNCQMFRQISKAVFPETKIK